MTRCKLMAFVFLVSSVLIAIPGFAQTDELDQLILQTENGILAGDDELVWKLVKFRAQVEAGAYEMTMNLCEGYRRARGLGDGSSHSPGSTSLEKSLAAWSKIFSEGLRHPFDAIGGIKSDYLDIHKAGALSFWSWFGSLYSLYLVRSWGFLGGAVHCLGTMDQREINLFASAIVAVDYEATLASETALFLTGDQVLRALIRMTSFVWSPARRLVTLVRRRMGRTPIAVSTMVALPIAEDVIEQRSEQNHRTENAIRELVNRNGPDYEKNQREARIFLMGLALRKFWAEWKLGDPEVPGFQRWAKERIQKSTLKEAHADLEAILNQRQGSQEFDARQVLETVLPILDQIELTN
jgi:hypothetical protein